MFATNCHLTQLVGLSLGRKAGFRDFTVRIPKDIFFFLSFFPFLFLLGLGLGLSLGFWLVQALNRKNYFPVLLGQGPLGRCELVLTHASQHPKPYLIAVFYYTTQCTSNSRSLPLSCSLAVSDALFSSCIFVFSSSHFSFSFRKSA